MSALQDFDRATKTSLPGMEECGLLFLAQELLLVGTPTWQEGEYEFQVYHLAKKALIDQWFPGRKDPNTRNDGGVFGGGVE